MFLKLLLNALIVEIFLLIRFSVGQELTTHLFNGTGAKFVLEWGSPIHVFRLNPLNSQAFNR